VGIVEQRKQSRCMNREAASKYRGLAARLNYLSLDRPDLQYAAKVASRYMAEPKEIDWKILKRVARYLIGAPRAVQTFKWQGAPTLITTYTDSDWAGDRSTRKSTSGGVMCVGYHMIKSWSSTQQNIALSSGEAELYAMVKGAAQTKGLMAMMNDFGLKIGAKICTDASAAIGIVHRQGLGKTRHIDVQYLWIQTEVNEGRLKVSKVATSSNPADLLTKALGSKSIQKHLQAIEVTVDTTRANKAPMLQ